MPQNACHVERRADGAIVVRVRSCDKHGQPLPDAVFAFRLGDCQYAKWDQYLRKLEATATPDGAPHDGHPLSACNSTRQAV
jgi:hypothetical protein